MKKVHIVLAAALVFGSASAASADWMQDAKKVWEQTKEKAKKAKEKVEAIERPALNPSFTLLPGGTRLLASANLTTAQLVAYPDLCARVQEIWEDRRENKGWQLLRCHHESYVNGVISFEVHPRR